MENYEKCWPHRCMYMGEEKIWFFSQTHSFRETRIKNDAEERSSAQRTQADHPRRESLKSNSSHEPRASGKPDAVFSSRSDELGNPFESSLFKYAGTSKLGRSLLEGNKDHLLSHARSDLMRQEHQVGSLKNCIGEIQQQAYAQGLELQDVHHGSIESRKEEARLQAELFMKENFSEILKYEIFMKWVR